MEICSGAGLSPGPTAIPGRTNGAIPGDATVRMKFPAASPPKENSPLLPETDVRSSPPFSDVSVTLAPGSVPPFASRTDPVIMADVSAPAIEVAPAASDEGFGAFGSPSVEMEARDSCAGAAQEKAQISSTSVSLKKNTKRMGVPASVVLTTRTTSQKTYGSSAESGNDGMGSVAFEGSSLSRSLNTS